MNFKTYAPPLPLSEFIDSFWFWQDDAAPESMARRLPTGSMEFVINLGERPFRIYDGNNLVKFERFDDLLICGVQREATLTNSSNRAIGVHFKPGGALPFLRMSVAELRDKHVSLEAIWGASARRLHSQLLEAKGIDRMFMILQSHLIANAVRPLSHHPAVALALKAFTNMGQARTVSELAQLTGYSRRRFIELFNEEVGLTPKIFARIRRFQAALELVREASRVNWCEIALAAGYYDQAHLIHDFQTFSGLTPTAYVEKELGKLSFSD
jgi:AraC-like DNA-binding protein